MATVFKMPGRPFWFAQIIGADGVRLPRKSTKKTKKREAEVVAEDWEAEERKRAKEGNFNFRKYARIVENAARLADEGKLTVQKSEEFIRELRRLANPDFKEVSLSAYWKTWNVHRAKQVAKSTADNYGHALKKWETVAADMMSRPMLEITVAQVRDGLSAMQSGDKPIATTTAAAYVAALKEVLDSALEEKLITINPARSRIVSKARRSTATKQAKKVGPFTLDEVRAIQSVASDEWKGMVLFAFHTGLRMMDIARLGRVNIDGQTLVVKSGKTNTDTRTPLHPQLVSWVKGRGAQFFPTIRTQDTSVTSNQFSRLMARVKVTKEATLSGGEVVKRSFHSLRHTFTSILANADVDKDVRMKLTGQTTSRVHSGYTHHDEAKLTDAISKLPTL